MLGGMVEGRKEGKEGRVGTVGLCKLVHCTSLALCHSKNPCSDTYLHVPVCTRTYGSKNMRV
jgi:hypothetical protein